MIAQHLTAEGLRYLLDGIPPLELKGTALLREHHPSGGWFPAGLPCDTIREAVAEVIAYTGRCTAASRRLAKLSPIPLTMMDVGFGI